MSTFTQLYIQVVFAVKGRQNLIAKSNREELHKYITGVVQNKGHKMLAVFCMPDHVHVLVGLKSDVSISDMVRDIKANSSRFINEKGWVKGRFNWQAGYGAFSYSNGHLDRVINYVLNQEEHHRKISFREEYISFLEEHKLEYNEKYLFEWID
jgi:REP element-mobilizing transposase RayT